MAIMEFAPTTPLRRWRAGLWKYSGRLSRHPPKPRPVGLCEVMESPQGPALLEAIDITKEYPTPRGPLRILSGVSLRLTAGQAASIMGPSGSGKSTLLHILGALDPPTSGAVTLAGTNPYQLHEKQLAAFRNQKIGFV